MTDASPIADEPAADEEPALIDLVKRGLRWSFAGTTIIRLGTFFSGLVMARILSPHEFGIYTVGAVALMLTASINDIGIEPTLVRWPGRFEDVAPTATTVVMVSSFAMFVAFWFAAPAFADFLNAPDGTDIVRLMSVGLLISGAFTVPSAFNTREFRQHVRMIGEISGTLVTIGVGIVLALAGLGAASLAWGHIVGNLTVGAILFIGSPRRFKPGFHWPIAKDLVKHGLPLAGALLLGIGILNVDYLVVGSILGATALGLYLLAWNLSSWPINLFSAAVNRVSVPAFARLQHDREASSHAFHHSMRLVVTITLPFCVLLAALADPVVHFLYGEKWEVAAIPLRFLAGVAAVRVATLLATDLLVAGGQGRATLGLQALWLVILTPALILGAHLDGLEGVGAAHLCVALFVATPAFVYAIHRRGVSTRALAGAMRRPIAGAALCGVVAACATYLPVRDVVQLFVGGILGLAAYLVVVRPIWAPLLAGRKAGRAASNPA